MIRGLGLLRLALTECEEETRSRNRSDLVKQSDLWIRNLPLDPQFTAGSAIYREPLFFESP